MLDVRASRLDQAREHLAWVRARLVNLLAEESDDWVDEELEKVLREAEAQVTEKK